MLDDNAILAALKKFAGAVSAKMNTLTAGEPEDQLRAPFEAFMEEVGRALGITIVSTGETLLAGRLGKPDYAIHAAGLLAGYVELKKPGLGANPSRFTGHPAQQWKRFQAIPNLIYCDGNDWGLYRDGKAVRPVVRLSGDIAADGTSAVTAKDAGAVLDLLRDFLQWQPIIPTKAKGNIDLKAFAKMLAPLCRMLRGDVTDALKDPHSPLVQLAKDWRQLLFPDASDDQFADAYAQTVTFGLLLARSEAAHPLTLASAGAALAAQHSLLSRALQVLTDPNAQAEITASLNLLIRVIGQVPPAALKSPRDPWLMRHQDSLPVAAKEDPWLFFYEEFLAAYDPELRKNAGAYYTPVEVVLAQVRLVDDLLTNRLGKSLGFADPGVVTLDPAAGTGTYLLAVIDHALARVQAEQGSGALPGKATALANNIYGLEIMAGPFAVSELRVTRALQDWGASLPVDGTHVYLTDTLESPHTTPPQLPLYLKPIADQHAKALKVKANVPVIVCLGNPPYDRHEAATGTNKARTGHWVRWGDDNQGTAAIFKDFLDTALASAHGIYVKNLYNLYVYFWRWALWKVFEHETAVGPGVVSFISASSYLAGESFCGMREHMRRLCDEIWILDLGGEGRGARKSENVFAIQTPVAIAVAVRHGKAMKDTPATVRYARIDGTRNEKLKALDAIADFTSFKWKSCPHDWNAPFMPDESSFNSCWPKLEDLFPWSASGVQFSRNWPVCPCPLVLPTRWDTLLAAKSDERRTLLVESADVRANRTYQSFLDGKHLDSLQQAKRTEQLDSIEPVLFRSFDRQWCIADRRVIHRPRPPLWQCRSDRQVFILGAPGELTVGPALSPGTDVPDLNAFNNRGGVTYPLYRDAEAKEANILPGLLEMLSQAYGRGVAPEDFLAYVYGVLAQPAFTERFAKELGTRELRVPLTKDAALFAQVRDVGANLLYLHTYAQRFVPKGKHKGQVPRGSARCLKAVPGEEAGYPDKYEYNDATMTLCVGQGQFAPVAPEVYAFEVSGLKVVQSWLKYRMKNGGGKKSSPLDDIRPERWTDDFTTELLELLWVLEATVEQYPAQAELLAAVVKGPCFKADELPAVPPESRKPPARTGAKGLFDASEDA